MHHQQDGVGHDHLQLIGWPRAALARRRPTGDARAMIRALLALLLVVLATPAFAADRAFTVTDFDRIRVEGPFEVHVTIGRGGATARASGDARVIANLSIEVLGGTIVIRKGSGGWSEQGKVDGPAPVITLTANALRSATVIAGGKLAIAGTTRATRLDLQITGAGMIDATGIDADDLVVTTLGAGNVSLAGKSARAKLLINGTGSITAVPLTVGDLIARLEGPGEIQASARYTADLTSTGLGRIVVVGNPKCTVRAQAGGPIQCGPGAKP